MIVLLVILGGLMSKTIMIIDDSATLRQVIKVTLQKAGYEVLEGQHGQEALDQLDGRKIHLMICDVNMPVMDGITFVTEVKKLQEYKFTPIVMLTTESQETKKLEGKAAGAKAWIVKPFKPEQLLNAVQKLILP
jgi:two-component system chemotaxis response regulator CheY